MSLFIVAKALCAMGVKINRLRRINCGAGYVIRIAVY